MQITRAKATALLNKGEMQLYDDSRHHPIRGFTLKQLQSRTTRARNARDRARDLVRRQKLASRATTGSKRGTSGAANQRSEDKLEILADILSRFQAQQKVAGKEQAAAAGKPPATAPARATKKTTRKAAKKAARKTVKKAARKAAAKKAPRKAGKVTAKQALRSTRKVLEAKQEEARREKPWQDVGGHGGQVPSGGYQSGAAARRAGDLHAAESRLPAIQGSIGTRGRISQGKRDSKGGGD